MSNEVVQPQRVRRRVESLPRIISSGFRNNVALRAVHVPLITDALVHLLRQGSEHRALAGHVEAGEPKVDDGGAHSSGVRIEVVRNGCWWAGVDVRYENLALVQVSVLPLASA